MVTVMTDVSTLWGTLLLVSDTNLLHKLSSAMTHNVLWSSTLLCLRCLGMADKHWICSSPSTVCKYVNFFHRFLVL